MKKALNKKIVMQILARPNQSEETTKPPPVHSFEIEMDLERRRVFLRYINRVWLIFGIVTLLSLPVFPKQRAEFIVLISVVFPSYLIIRFLNQSGRTRLAGVILTFSVNFGFYGLFMVLVGELGGYKAFETETTVWMLMGLAVLFAGAFVDKWVAPSLALINTMLLIGTRLTIAPNSDPRPSVLVFWWMMALTIWLYERTLGLSLGRLLSELADRRQAQAALRESQQRLSLFFNQSLDGFFFSMLDEPIEWHASNDKEKLINYVLTHQRITEANNAMLEQYGATRENFIGRTANDFFANDLDQARSFRKSLFDTGHLHLETEERKDDGTPIWVEGDYVCMYDHQKRIIGMFGIQRDVTLRKKAEEDIHKQNRFVSALAETIPGLVYVYDWETDSNVYSNRGIEYMLGYTSEEVKAMGTKLFALLFNPDDAAAVVASQQKLASASDQEVFEIDYRLRHSNGEWRWLRSYERPFARSKDGSLKQKIGIAIDITERKQAEDVLQEAEEKYRNLVERLTQVIYTSELGTNGVWAYVSPQIEQLLGYTPQEWLADSALWYQQVHPEDRDKQLLLEDEAYINNEAFEGEYRILTRAGNWIWVQDSGHILPSQSEGPPIVQGVLMDITERKRAEEDLSLSKTQLLANLEYTPNVAVQWYDKDGHVLYWNPASESMYGWKSIDVIGKKLDQLIYTPKEQAEFMDILAEVQATGEPFGPYEAQIRRHDNTTGWVLATTFSIPMNDEQIGFVGMNVDITERKQAEEQYQKQLRRLNALHTVDMAINSGANIEIILEVLLNQALSQLNADAADVLLYNQTAQILELGAERGFRSNIAHPSHQRLGDFHAGQIINQRSTLHIQNMMETGKHLKRTPMLAGESFIDYVGVPLIAKGQIKGVLEIYQRSPLDANVEWFNFLEVLAGQAAIAIDNSQLLQGLQKSTMEIILAYDATIEGWSHAMDLRDKETEGHTQRVTAMTLQLAQALSIRETDIIHIQRGGLLHDIGKIGVPDGILLKHDKLTDEEWEIMRQHPTYAFNMLAPISYLKNAIDIPYCHHEKWDGTGYPRGLKGEQIPLSARIFAVADVWDALTSDRPYRKAWSKEQTVEYIKEQSGSQFDPQIVEVFLKMISE
jgi:PAS domain S-box-containing protein